jgi:hypothetical protein
VKSIGRGQEHERSFLPSSDPVIAHATPSMPTSASLELSTNGVLLDRR